MTSIDYRNVSASIRYLPSFLAARHELLICQVLIKKYFNAGRKKKAALLLIQQKRMHTAFKALINSFQKSLDYPAVGGNYFDYVSPCKLDSFMPPENTSPIKEQLTVGYASQTEINNSADYVRKKQAGLLLTQDYQRKCFYEFFNR